MKFFSTIVEHPVIFTNVRFTSDFRLLTDVKKLNVYLPLMQGKCMSLSLWLLTEDIGGLHNCAFLPTLPGHSCISGNLIGRVGFFGIGSCAVNLTRNKYYSFSENRKIIVSLKKYL